MQGVRGSSPLSSTSTRSRSPAREGGFRASHHGCRCQRRHRAGVRPRQHVSGASARSLPRCRRSWQCHPAVRRETPGRQRSAMGAAPMPFRARPRSWRRATRCARARLDVSTPASASPSVRQQCEPSSTTGVSDDGPCLLRVRGVERRERDLLPHVRRLRRLGRPGDDARGADRARCHDPCSSPTAAPCTDAPRTDTARSDRGARGLGPRAAACSGGLTGGPHRPPREGSCGEGRDDRRRRGPG